MFTMAYSMGIMNHEVGGNSPAKPTNNASIKDVESTLRVDVSDSLCKTRKMSNAVTRLKNRLFKKSIGSKSDVPSATYTINGIRGPSATYRAKSGSSSPG